MRKILIRRDEGIGDVIMLTSVMKAFQEANSDAELFIQTKYPEVVQNRKVFTEIYKTPDETPNNRFDRFLDLRWSVEAIGIGKGRASFEEYANINRIDLFRARCGLPDKSSFWPSFDQPVKPAAREFANNIFGKLTGRYRILCNFFCASPTRSYDLNHALELVDLLSKIDRVVISGTSPQKLWPGRPSIDDFNVKLERLLKKNKRRISNVMDQTTLIQGIGLIAQSDLVITIDTGALHIAGALGKNQIPIFGNITPYLRTKYYARCHPVYRKKLPCQPCEDFSPFKDAIMNCMKNTVVGAPCMKGVMPSDIHCEVKRILNG